MSTGSPEVTVSGLLRRYDRLLRSSDDLSLVVWSRRDRGMAERFLPLPRPAWLVYYFVLLHVTRSTRALARRYAALGPVGEDPDPAGEQDVREFRESLPTLPTKTLLTALLIVVLISAQLMLNLGDSLLPRTTGEDAAGIRTAHVGFLADLVVPTVTLDIGGIKGVLDHVASASLNEIVAVALVLVAALWVVARLFLGSFQTKRLLMACYPEVPAEHPRGRMLVEPVRGYTGLYAYERDLFGQLSGRPPREPPVDAITSVLILLWPLVLGVASLVLAVDRGREELVFLGLLLLELSLWRGAWLYSTWRAREAGRRGQEWSDRSDPALTRWLWVVALALLAATLVTGI